MEKFKFYALWLVLVCIFVYILQLLINGFTELFILDADYPFQIWRYLTSIFLHASLSHIVFNMFALALFGSLLERLIGGKRFLLVFLASGIIANIISINFYPSSLGASGAIYGVIGALMIVRPLMFVWAFGLPLPMILAGILYALSDLVGLFIPSDVGHIAHLSGIVVGIILGAFYRPMVPRKERRQEIRLDEASVRRWEDYYLK